MDFMNLHQSAHGDREFAFIQTRLRRGRKTVVGHWQDPQVSARLGWWARAAAGWHESHRLRIARFGDNMREVAVTDGDKVEAQARLGFSVNGYGVADLVERVAAVPEAEVDTLVDAYATDYELAPALRSGGDRHAELRTAARIEGGPAVVPGRGRVRRLHRHVRGPGRAPAAARDRRPAADGRRLRLRRGGRLEGRRARPDPQGGGRRPARRHLVHGGLHLPPGRPGPRGARCPHARGLPVDRRREAVVRDPPAVDRRPRRPGAAGVRRRPGARHRRRPRRPRRPLPAHRQRGGPRRARRAAAATPRRARGLAATPRPADRRRGLAHGRRTAPHRADDDAADGGSDRLRGDGRHRARDRSTPPRRRPRSGASSAGTRRSTSSSAGRERAGGGRGDPHVRPGRARPADARGHRPASPARRAGRVGDRRLLGRADAHEPRADAAARLRAAGRGRQPRELPARGRDRDRPLPGARDHVRRAVPVPRLGRLQVARGRGWELGRAWDDGIAAMADQAIELVAAAQRDDGYLNTFVQVLAPGREYRDLQFGHELYCIGHLVQAAVAWHRALGDDRLLAVARRAADSVDAALGPSRRRRDRRPSRDRDGAGRAVPGRRARPATSSSPDSTSTVAATAGWVRTVRRRRTGRTWSRSARRAAWRVTRCASSTSTRARSTSPSRPATPRCSTPSTRAGGT